MKREFAQIAGMRGVVGLIDGTHIVIKRPVHFEKAFVNRKNKHSLNVQVIIKFTCNRLISTYIQKLILDQGICGPDYKFYSVCATKPGSCHDSSILKNSTIGKKFASGAFGQGILLGDSGYANTTYLFTPYSEPRNATEVNNLRANVVHYQNRLFVNSF